MVQQAAGVLDAIGDDKARKRNLGRIYAEEKDKRIRGLEL
jgi:hypothetical protein